MGARWEEGEQGSPRYHVEDAAQRDDRMTKMQTHARRVEIAVVAGIAAVIGSAAAVWYWRAGELLNYGDAMAHLNIARRLVDTRTPGMLQIGTVWLPLPHVLMAPFAASDWLWRTGLAGAIPGVAALVMAAVAMFLLLRERCGMWPAAVGAAMLAANPSVVYLAVVPMSEVLLLAALLWAVYLALDTRRVALAGFVATLACMTRYEAWPLAPVLALVVLRRDGLDAAVRFSALAAAGPLWWMAHNWWFYGDALEFYRGEYSARAIYARQLAEGVARHPAGGNWWMSARYLATATWMMSPIAVIAGVAGWTVREYRALSLGLILSVPPAFLFYSLHSAGLQIYVPGLWPDTLMNTRYAVSALPVLATGAALLCGRSAWRTATVAALAGLTAIGPSLTRAEGEAVSRERRMWTEQAAPFLAANYRGGGIALSFGDLTGVLQGAGVPLKEALHDGDRLRWESAMARPDLFLKEEWALCFEGDALSRAIQRSGRYRLARRFQKAEFWTR